jgi:hypothetical protein
MRGLVAGALAFAVFFLVQAGGFHWVKISRRALTLVGLWVAGLPVYVWLYVWLPEDRAVWPVALAAPSDSITVLSGGLLYFFLFMGYAQFFYMAESSVGVRTMIELASEPERGLTLEELTQRYRYDWMLDRRLRRMIHAGYLIEEDGWYRTTHRGRLTAAVMAWCKQLLRLGPGG